MAFLTMLLQKRAILLSVCGASTYQLMWNLSAPAKPIEKLFAELRSKTGTRSSSTPAFQDRAAI